MPLFGDLNRMEILGNMTQDPELRYTPSGTAVCSFSVATNRRFKQGEEYKDEVTFHNVVVWGNLAQGVAQRAKKGTRVMVLGHIQNRSGEGNDGQKRYRTELVAEDLYLIDRYEKGKMEGQPAPTATQPSTKAPTNEEPAYSSSDDVINPDDLPF